MAPSRLHAVRPSPHPRSNRYPLQWITRISLELRGPAAGQMSRCSPPGSLLRPSAAVELCSGGQRRRSLTIPTLGRPIKKGRARLDRLPIRSEALDLDPTAHTRE